jgi:hypothetical protein
VDRVTEILSIADAIAGHTQRQSSYMSSLQGPLHAVVADEPQDVHVRAGLKQVMVTIMAITPSLNASMRPLLISIPARTSALPPWLDSRLRGNDKHEAASASKGSLGIRLSPSDAGLDHLFALDLIGLAIP